MRLMIQCAVLVEQRRLVTQIGSGVMDCARLAASKPFQAMIMTQSFYSRSISSTGQVSFVLSSFMAFA